jgi:hypothetical protein
MAVRTASEASTSCPLAARSTVTRRGAAPRWSSRLQNPAHAGSIEQLDAELTLELGDRLRERRLRDVQLLRGPDELALLGDRYEVEHLAAPERHRSLAARSPRRRWRSRLLGDSGLLGHHP